MRIAVCDNDSAFLADTVSILESWAEGRSDLMIEAFPTGQSLIEGHIHRAFDVIMLDTVMASLDGIEVARKIRSTDQDVRLVFLASSADGAVESYKVRASDYLLKPIDQADLLQCANRLEKEVRAMGRRISFRGVRSKWCTNVSSIEYVKANGRHSSVALSSGEVINSIEPFHYFEEILSPDDGFFKCRRGCIVNINHVTVIGVNEVVVGSGRSVRISRGCRPSFKKTHFPALLATTGD